MFSQQHALCVVTAVLPTTMAEHVVDVLMAQANRAMLVWNARGTTVRDHWYARWLPPISPVKEVVQLVVPQPDVDAVLATIITEGRLDLQATGAVFATRCETAFRGTAFAGLADVTQANDGPAVAAAEGLRRNLQLLTCVVAPRNSERVSRAAIDAGAHGPIVHYVEGRGLRDRLGWLRITKEQDKEQLMVLATKDNADDVFAGMAAAGDFHRPGRGIMYAMDVDKGLFHLPGLISHHRHAASMQQIINAIDHLQRHTHWRDQSGYSAGNAMRRAGQSTLAPQNHPTNLLAINAIARRDDLDVLMGVMLSAGAPGLSMNYSRIAQPQTEPEATGGARVNREYVHVRSITDPITAKNICANVETACGTGRLTDLFGYTTSIPRVVMYVPGKREYRKAG